MSRRIFTKDEREYIEKNYPNGNLQEISTFLGIKKANLIAYASRHGISNNRFWKQEETEYLLENFGYMTTSSIAKKLGKTQRQVIEKVQKLGIGNFIDNCEHLCLAEVSRLVGRDKETIKKTWFKHGLKWRKKGKYTIIRRKDLFLFMEQNTKYWNAKDCEEWFFDNFEWFQKKKHEERAELFEIRWGGILKELEGK